MFATLTATILRRRWSAGLLLVALVGAAVLGVLRLTADFSVAAFFGRQDPETGYLDEYLERWNEDDMLILALDGGSEYAFASREGLERIDAIAQAMRGLEGVDEVISLSDLPRVSRTMIGGTFLAVPLLATAPREDPSSERALRWRENLLSDPRLVPNFLSPDGRYAAIPIVLSVANDDLALVRPVVHGVEEAVHQWETDGLQIHVAGVPAIRADILDVIVKDQVVLVPVSAFLMGLLMLGLFRSRHGVLIPAVAAAVPIAMLLGTMGWTGEPFGLLNQVLLALVPAIAVADAIHLVSRFHEESRALADGETMDDATRDQAIIQAMSYMGVACFLTSFTTVIGFLSLLATDMPVLRGFGLYAAVGVAFAYFTVLLIVPLALLGTRSGARRIDHGAEGALGSLLELAVQLTTRYARSCLAGAVVAFAACLYVGSWVQVDTKITGTFAADHPTTQGNRIVDDELGGVVAFEFDLKGPAGSFARPEVLEALDRLETYARKLESVRTTFSPAALMRSTSVMVGGPDAVPTRQSHIDRFYSLNKDSEAMQRFVSADQSRGRLIIRVVDIGARSFLKLGDHLADRFRVELATLGVDAHLTGSTFVAYRGLSRVTTDLRDSLMMAFGTIGIIIAVLFRNFWLGLLSLLPNALPLAFGYGMMGLFGWTLEPAPAIVFTIAIGISVDSAIHIIARFREERQEHHASVDQAIRSSIFHSGRAVVITAVILAVGFAVNTWSSSPANASFGKVGTVVVISAILSNLFVLPALLKLLFETSEEG